MSPAYQLAPTTEDGPQDEKTHYYVDELGFEGDYHTEDPELDWAGFKKGRFSALQYLAGALLIVLMSFTVTSAYLRMLPGGSGSVRAGCHHGAQRMKCVLRGQHCKMHNATGLPTSFTLPSGDKIPSVALGVWRAPPGEVVNAVKAALETGYRHIDGAWIYGNEAEVGQAIEESGVSRKDIWLTSKLWNSFHDPSSVEKTLDESLAKLGTDYLDLYLIHWPVAFKKGSTSNEVDWDLTENPYPTWQKLEEMVAKGKVRNIGVSNFNIRRLQNLTANPLKIKPAINQVELSYWNPQPELVAWAKENDLLLEAYSPLGSQEKVKETLAIPEVKKIASELGITPAQAHISWQLQRGIVVLPKSVHANRIEENFKVTALPKHAFNVMEKLATSHKPERSVNPSKSWGVDIFN